MEEDSTSPIRLNGGFKFLYTGSLDQRRWHISLKDCRGRFKERAAIFAAFTLARLEIASRGNI